MADRCSTTPATDWLAHHARVAPDRIALTDAATGDDVSYGAWNDRVNRTARLLARRGVTRGDRVAVLARRRVDALDVWLACGKMGAVAQMLNVRLTASELAEQLAPSPKLLVHGDEEPAWASLDAPRVTLAELRSARASEPPSFESAAVGPDDPWVICYTGGSTGAPRGAVLTHGSIQANAVATVDGWGIRADDSTVLTAPLFHVGGLLVLTAPLLLVGGRSIVCDRFDAGEVIDLIAGARVTTFFGVPTMHASLCRHSRFATSDLSSLRFVVSGGAPCPESVVDAMRARGVPFREGYGLTEAGPNNFFVPDSELDALRCRVGYPLPGVEARIVGPGDAPLAPGVPGELCLRGAHLFAGYLAARIDNVHDGWLRTGDLAVVDARGAFSIVGRLKDVIFCGGENVYPAEVEGVLAAHSEVAEVCVIPLRDARLGEVGRAVVVPQPSAETFPTAELLAFARMRLARFKVPRDIVVAEALPRTSTGKVDRRAVLAAFGTESRLLPESQNHGAAHEHEPFPLPNDAV